MAKRCEVCGRGSTSGTMRSHSNRKTLKRQNINLQSQKIGGQTTKVCVNCMKTAKKKIAEIKTKISTGKTKTVAKTKVAKK